MSANDTIDSLHDGNLIAAEYVLGREVERRLTREPALAAEVAFWEERLTGLTDVVAPCCRRRPFGRASRR
jgi:anti-sigma-K factor RskA